MDIDVDEKDANYDFRATCILLAPLCLASDGAAPRVTRLLAAVIRVRPALSIADLRGQAAKMHVKPSLSIVLYIC